MYYQNAKEVFKSSSDPLNISFENLSYIKKCGVFNKIEKRILRNLNGEFRAGEFSAVIGASGSGKSTLLDILAGYTTKNVRGFVRINNNVRTKKQPGTSSYIMQDSVLHDNLTVYEAMKFSINLKCGIEVNSIDKEKRVQVILKSLALKDSLETYTGCLSGGEKKRLSIALELINDPAIMIFDEPTSGLDILSATQCLSILKKLADNGKTIICSIHQPSAVAFFNTFHHIYAISNGECIYQGAPNNAIQYLAEVNLICPESYNPSDYILEVSSNEYGLQNDLLIKKIQNGMNNSYRTDVVLPIIKTKSKSTATKIVSECNLSYATTFSTQFYYLLIRTFLILSRNKTLTMARLATHLIIATMIGFLYKNIGNEGSYIIFNFRFIFLSIGLPMYSSFSTMQVTFPLELSIIKREHFNGWYSIKAYYAAFILSDFPTQTLCTTIYVVITYVLTNQPAEMYRFMMFLVVCLMAAFNAQGLGLMVGSIFNLKMGSILGSFFVIPFLIYSGFFVKMSEVNYCLQWLFHISFFKYALDGAMHSIYGFDRPKLDCKEDYCHFVYPTKFMTFVEMPSCSYQKALFSLFMFVILFRLFAFCIIKSRLKK